VTAGWRRELQHRRAEQRARAMVRVANRTFTTQPNLIDKLAHRLVAKAVGRSSPPPERS
jgi:hypothetical protein